MTHPHAHENACTSAHPTHTPYTPYTHRRARAHTHTHTHTQAAQLMGGCIEQHLGGDLGDPLSPSGGGGLLGFGSDDDDEDDGGGGAEGAYDDGAPPGDPLAQ